VRKAVTTGGGFSQVDNFADRIFFVTSLIWGRRPLFQSEPAARLLRDTVFSYHECEIFELYEFVIMPDHIHLFSWLPRPRSRWNVRCSSLKAAILIAS
jgi:REP element-mobilizing transposase RayT